MSGIVKEVKKLVLDSYRLDSLRSKTKESAELIIANLEAEGTDAYCPKAALRYAQDLLLFVK